MKYILSKIIKYILSKIIMFFLRIAIRYDFIYINVWEDGRVSTFAPDRLFQMNNHSVDISVILDDSIELDKNGKPIR